MVTDLDRKKQLFQGCQVLDAFGVTDEQGHLSTRVEPGSDTVIINENSSPGTTSLQEFVWIGIHDDEFPDGIPSEIPIHTEIYRARDDVNAICHNHSPYALTVCSVGLEMRPVHQVGAIQADPIPVYEDYHDEGGTLVTTDEEATDMMELMGDNQAIMLRGHGAVVVGENVTQAVLRSIKLEYNARLIHRQAQIGEPWYLTRDLAQKSVDLNEGESKLEKSLDYYLTKAE